MITHITRICFLLAVLLTTLTLLPACNDDPASPVATHVKVKAVYQGCDWITLQILNFRYTAWGQKDFNCWDNGNCMSAVRVERLQNLAYWDKLELYKEYYVDMKRIQPQQMAICDIAPGPPDAAVTLLNLY